MEKEIIYSSLIFLSFISIVWFIYLLHRDKIRLDVLKNFPDYMGLLDYYLDKAFNIIYKEKIFIFSIEATKPSENQYSTISKDFVTLLLKLLGTNLKREFIRLYGNEETFMFNVLEYFSSKYENDEIRNEALDNIVQSDNELE